MKIAELNAQLKPKKVQDIFIEISNTYHGVKTYPMGADERKMIESEIKKFGYEYAEGDVNFPHDPAEKYLLIKNVECNPRDITHEIMSAIAYLGLGVNMGAGPSRPFS